MIRPAGFEDAEAIVTLIRRNTVADGSPRREALAAAVRSAGFPCAVLDLEPFRSGRMNEMAGLPRPAEQG